MTKHGRPFVWHATVGLLRTGLAKFELVINVNTQGIGFDHFVERPRALMRCFGEDSFPLES